MTLIEQLRYAAAHFVHTVPVTMNEAADRLEQAEKIIAELESAIHTAHNFISFRDGVLTSQCRYTFINEALASVKLFKEGGV